MVAEKIAQLIRQYEEQIKVYGKMHALAKAQLQLWADEGSAVEDSLPKFNELLFKRQKQMDLIEESQQAVQAIKLNLQEELDFGEISVEVLVRYYPSPETFQLQEKIKQIGDLLKEIASLDIRTQEFLGARLKLLKEEIEKNQTARKAHKAYNLSEKQKEGYFLDRSK